MEIRPEIMKFAEAMETVMKKNDPGKGESWKHTSSTYMNKKLLEEVMEYLLTQHSAFIIMRMSIDALNQVRTRYVHKEDYDYIFNKTKTKHPEELIDSGNMCMMIYDNMTRPKGDKNDKNKPI